MSESWYCLVFGAELGPMSWDDLVHTAARGALRPADQVRRGNDGKWQSASAVEGLFDAAAAVRAVAVPPPSDGKSDASAHEAAEDDTAFEVDAALAAPPQIDELDFDLAAPASASDTDFDLVVPAASQPAAEDTDFDIAPAPVVPPREDDRVERSSRGTTESKSSQGTEDTASSVAPAAAQAEADDFASAMIDELGDAATRKRAQSAAMPSPPKMVAPSESPQHPGPKLPAAGTPEEPRTDSPVVAAQETKTSSRGTKEPEKKELGKKRPVNKRAEKQAAAKGGPRIQLSAGSVRGLLAVAGVVCLAGLGYLAFLALSSSKSANYATILTSYQQLYDEVNRIRQNHGASLAPDTMKSFLDAVNAVRQPLANAQPGTIDDRLYQAGGLLVEMLANATAEPQSDAEVRYINSEKGYQDLIVSVRGELGL